MAHFIPLKTRKAEELAEVFIREIWKFHGLPIDIISDRDPVFTSKFWQAVMTLLGIKTALSTAFRPQTDGQSERVNQIIEQFLRIYSNYEQDNWVDLLPLGEFAYNNAEQASTGMTPFYVCTGQHPIAFVEIEGTSNHKDGQEWAEKLESIHADVRLMLTEVQQRMEKYYNRKVGEQPAFKIGDKVMLSAKNLKTKRRSKKLDQLYRGPCTIVRAVGDRAFELSLPPQLQGKMHPVFHVALLEKYIENTIPGRTEPPEPPTGDDLDFYEAAEIVDSKHIGRGRGRRVLYLVKWTGYGRDDMTWEPYENIFEGAEQLLLDFHMTYPEKARDLRVKV
jgi:hypothetical protein